MTEEKKGRTMTEPKIEAIARADELDYYTRHGWTVQGSFVLREAEEVTEDHPLEKPVNSYNGVERTFEVRRVVLVDKLMFRVTKETAAVVAELQAELGEARHQVTNMCADLRREADARTQLVEQLAQAKARTKHVREDLEGWRSKAEDLLKKLAAQEQTLGKIREHVGVKAWKEALE